MIVALEDAKYKLLGMRESIAELGSALRIEETKEMLFDLEAQTQAPDFWNSAEKSSKVLQTIKQGQDKVASCMVAALLRYTIVPGGTLPMTVRPSLPCLRACMPGMPSVATSFGS